MPRISLWTQDPGSECEDGDIAVGQAPSDRILFEETCIELIPPNRRILENALCAENWKHVLPALKFQ